MVSHHEWIQKVLAEEVQLGQRFVLCFVILVDEGKEDPSTTISRPLSVHQQNTINGVLLARR